MWKKQEIEGISVSLYGNSIDTNSYTESSSGYRNFTVSTSGDSVYIVTWSINSASNHQYLPNGSTFTIYTREIDLSKVIVKERETKYVEKLKLQFLLLIKTKIVLQHKISRINWLFYYYCYWIC